MIDKEKKKAREKAYYQANRERIIAYRKEHKAEHNIATAKYRKAHGEEIKEYHKTRYGAFKEQAFDYYGRVCVCCGETELAFLTIDHINGYGTQHRKKIGTSIYKWLVQNNFPEGFQTLCWNCNWGKRLLGACPHQIKVRIA